MRDGLKALSKRAPLLDEFVQREPLDELHADERHSIGASTEVINRDDRGVLESGRDSCLAQEPLLGVTAGRDVPQFLDCDQATQVVIVRTTDTAHSAAGELRAEDVSATLIEFVRRARLPRRRARRSLRYG